MKVKPITDREAHIFQSRGSRRHRFDFNPSKEEPLNLNEFSGRLFGGKMSSRFSGLASSFLRFSHLNDVYHQSDSKNREGEVGGRIFETTLETLGSRLEVSDKDLDRIPEKGPLLVVANHPLGGLDGLALMSLILKRRPDCKLLANSILARFDAFRPFLIAVDVLGEENASAKNASALKGAVHWMMDGGCLVAFPAGQVSNWRWRARCVSDRAWNPAVAAIAKKTNASVVPVFFEGRNSVWFQGAGCLHPRLRTLLLGRELWNRRRTVIRARVGESLAPSCLQNFSGADELNDYLRLRVEALRGTANQPKRRIEKKPLEPLAKNPFREDVEREVRNLPEEAELTRKGDFVVYSTQATNIPNIMREIGILRELTFRDIGEGTGKNIDMDSFDEYYHQLFAWDENARKIVGGYRWAVTDEVLREKGRQGLYVSSLFSLRKSFYKAMGPAVELGRSFIRPEYQRKLSLLGLLWRGIGEFLNRRPGCCVLYGPVSISAAYAPISRNLMARFLRRKEWSPNMARRARAKHPFRGSHLPLALKRWLRDEGRSIEEISAIVSSVEQDGKGVPVLVKHYLKLNGSFVSFGVDPDFANALDGLIVVDMRDMTDAHLRRYFGEEGMKRMTRAREERQKNY
ncbi:MAG: GNAT family N-acetyltransferase [Verrucomicrobia bacterium]|nr:GNAT family N-acetyltransferase [Verrucomicrobiota bacterium]